MPLNQAEDPHVLRMFPPPKSCWADDVLHAILCVCPCVRAPSVKPGSGKVCLPEPGALSHTSGVLVVDQRRHRDQTDLCFDWTLPLLLSMINEQSVTAAPTFTLPSSEPTRHFNLVELGLLHVQWTQWVRGLQSVGTWSEGRHIEEDGWFEKSKGSWRLAGEELVNRSAVLMKAYSTVACRPNTSNKAADIKEADSSVQFWIKKHSCNEKKCSLENGLMLITLQTRLIKAWITHKHTQHNTTAFK